MGCVFIRHGGKHDWYQNPKTKVSQPVPRHREIKEQLAKHIIKMLGDLRVPKITKQQPAFEPVNETWVSPQFPRLAPKHLRSETVAQSKSLIISH
jgi:mRNA interferase HicA